MLTRQNALHTWLNSLNNNHSFQLTPLAGDASFRRYFRLHSDTSSHVVMDAPPGQEGLSAFVDIAKILATSGVRTPEILAFDLKQGFALLEDFGDALLLDDIHSDQTDGHYKHALDTLHNMQGCTIHTPKLATFDLRFMEDELQLFRTWFLERWLGITLSNIEENLLNNALTHITEQIIKQPQCFIHSDYHSRNIALIGQGDQPTIGVLDFQDAMLGPFTYDLVSLLKDAYVEWPKDTQMQWLDYFYTSLPEHHGWSRDAFEHGFHLCGLQRHLKILGIFCRLDQRDGKPRYLQDLPLTFNYILNALKDDKALHPFYDFMQTRVYPIFETKKIT
ncbi:MAG: phosphotransferase [Gammaproteobacteria bacterium]|nr:phosphotransferase [Gammaproteobacteria bacterium]